MKEELEITSPAFNEGDWIPVKNSARGDDLSPQIDIRGISDKGKSIAITMDDSSHPLFPNYNHWIIWNIPIQNTIPPAIPSGKVVEKLGGAIQGIAYGKHCYKGPKPPLKTIHIYTFTVYILDCTLELAPKTYKKEFLSAIEGHVLQKATLKGKFQSRRKEE